MNLVLWLLQGFLAFAFLFLGSLQLRQSKNILAGDTTLMGKATHLSAGHLKVIGFVQIAGALGLVEPWAFGVAKVVTPISAACLAGLMTGAVVLLARRKEPFTLPMVLGALAACVAIGRFSTLPG